MKDYIVTIETVIHADSDQEAIDKYYAGDYTPLGHTIMAYDDETGYEYEVID